MTSTLSKIDILRIVETERKKRDPDISEGDGISLFAGEGDDRTPLIGMGFKIRNKDSGYTYTCVKLLDRDDGAVLVVKDDANGDYYAIPSSDISNYERM